MTYGGSFRGRVAGAWRCPPRWFALGVLGLSVVVLAAGILLGALEGDLKSHFEEKRFVTVYSTLLLLWMSWVTGGIFLRRKREQGPQWKRGALLWLLISAGFLFLSIDEYQRVHEALDEVIHEALGMEETALSDRLDDLIVALYGAIGVGVLVYFRREALAGRHGFGWLAFGIVFAFLMIGLDAAVNRRDVMRMVFDRETVRWLHPWLSVGEDGLKVVAETSFLCWGQRLSVVLDRPGQESATPYQGGSKA